MKITTTLNKIKSFKPCENGWEKLLLNLGKEKADDEPVEYIKILKSNGLKDVIWAFRCEPQFNIILIKFTLECVKRVKHLMKHKQSLCALDAIQNYISCKITKEELRATTYATDAAYAADAADAAADAAAYAASYAAYAAAADAAAYSVAYATYAASANANAYSASYAASSSDYAYSATSSAASAASAATSTTSSAAAYAAERKKQTEILIRILDSEESEEK